MHSLNGSDEEINKVKKHVADRIRELRVEAGLTQQELADNLGTHHRAVQNWEGNKATPELSTLVKLAVYFDKPVTWFLEEDSARGMYDLARNLIESSGSRIISSREAAMFEQFKTFARALQPTPPPQPRQFRLRDVDPELEEKLLAQGGREGLERPQIRRLDSQSTRREKLKNPEIPTEQRFSAPHIEPLFISERDAGRHASEVVAEAPEVNWPVLLNTGYPVTQAQPPRPDDEQGGKLALATV